MSERDNVQGDFAIEDSMPKAGASLESILCTEELQSRKSRPPDFARENRALVALVSALADSPQTIFQTLAETILDITQSDSAGLSLLTRDGKTPDGCGNRFYWPAIAGMWNPHVGGGTPRHFGPCGDVLDQNRTLLFRHFERRYPYLTPVIPAAEECLLVPFYVAGKAVGTIWGIMHSDRREFDAEDDRIMASLGKFASSAYQALTHIEEDLKLQVVEREKAEAEVRADIGIALARKDSLRTILDLCVKAIVRHFDATFARIWTLSRDGRELELQASAGLYTRLDGSYSRIPFGKLTIGCIAQERKPHLTNDVQSDPRVGDHDWARAENITSFAGYPLVVEDRAVGVMGMFSRESLTEETLDTLAFISDGIAQCIERKQAEEQLRRSEAKVRRLVEANVVGIVMWNLDGAIVEANEAFLHLLQYSREELSSGRVRWKDLTPAEWHDRDDRAIAEMKATSICQPFEKEFVRKDGGRVPVLLGGALFEASGNEGVAFVLDLSEQKRAERALRRSEAFLAEAQHLSQIGSFSWRVATDEITWSEQLYRIYELEIGVPVTLELIRTRVHPEDVSFDREDENGRPGAGGSNDFEWQYRLRMPDHSIKYMHAVAHATRDQDGQLEYIAAIQDVTALRLSEEALDKARSELARVARAMSLGTLTASIAHELNQPLSGIVTNASTCLRMLATEPPNVNGALETARRTIRDANRGSEVITRLRDAL